MKQYSKPRGKMPKRRGWHIKDEPDINYADYSPRPDTLLGLLAIAVLGYILLKGLKYI